MKKIVQNQNKKRKKRKKKEKKEEEEELTEIEDIGQVFTTAISPKPVPEETSAGPQKEMLDTRMRENLTKQGYKLIGSHSGVKLCRWTKAMLRGRGGCYKHTFYGIMSFNCMEMTPSLACANKCVFCWRHHTNPVGKEWKWVMDNPSFIVSNAMQQHAQMIKEMKGVPGVKPERLAEAMRIKHCALSLVGEPIMYPKINAIVDMLHHEDISTFLVTNAQFPEAIEALNYVTQLYVSVDAADPASLKKVDRPLFKDYWERFMHSLKALRAKQQRTVYRLTLVKDNNMDGIANYARLVAVGQPSFIEVKGVTYCGKSDGSSLTMANVPFHFEVKAFCERLVKYLENDYELACEHEHSCCCLLAHKQFKVNGEWHTWIDYDKFHQLIKSGHPFTAVDYMQKTPQWAVWNAIEQGFNPNEIKFVKDKQKETKGSQKYQTKVSKAMNETVKETTEFLEHLNNGENPYLTEKEVQSKG